MPKFKTTIHVTTKKAVLNPEEKTTLDALKEKLGFKGVEKIQMGKCLILTEEAESETVSRQNATEMCERLLRNPVTDDFEIVSVQQVS